jgi:hypothetical protein
MSTIVEETRSILHFSEQAKVVGDYLVKHGFISRHIATIDGIPGYGKVLNCAGRIFDLRQAGWMIRTVPGANTHWHLVSWPGGEKPAGPSFGGFLKWLAEQNLSNVEGRARSGLYKKYVSEFV